jgi:hypothetical protein
LLGLKQPPARVARPSLPLVDVAEQEQCLRLELGAAELGRRIVAMSARRRRSSLRRSGNASPTTSSARV